MSLFCSDIFRHRGTLISLGEECAHPERRMLFEKKSNEQQHYQEDILEGVISQPLTC